MILGLFLPLIRRVLTLYWLGLALFILAVIICSGCNSKSLPVKDNNRQPESLEETREVTQASHQNTPLPAITSSAILEDNANKQVETIFQGEVALFTRVEEHHQPSSYIDLDKGKIGLGDQQKGDIEFCASRGTMTVYFINPVNGARAYANNFDAMTFDECSKHLSSYMEGSIPQFFNGKAICILTDEGRIALIRYKTKSIHVGYLGEASILLEVIVWKPIITSR